MTRLLHLLTAALLPFALLVGLAAGPFAADASAQKLASKPYEDTAHGFRFKPLDGYSGVPAQPDDTSGLVTQMVSGANELHVYALVDEQAPTRKERDGRSTAGKRRRDIAAVLAGTIGGFAAVADKPELDDEVKAKDLTGRRRLWTVRDWYVEAWTYTLPHADIALVYISEKQRFDKRWRATVDASGKSFQAIARKENSAGALGTDATYEEQLARAAEDAAKTPGWRAEPTPSKKFIIVTNCQKAPFVKEVVKRLEGARLIFEADYPPPPSFNAVSIVRICANEDEFHRYGNTGGGVAGWFSPDTTELVLYDAVNIDRNMTYAVVVHESFHQYCHFLFDQAEAHRWFDEGHGDYYGGLEFKGSRPKITTQMPGGLDRLTELRELVREGTYKPIAEHVNYDHRQWQTQGPTGVSCYAQSWGLVYYLRQGAEGKVPRKVWRPEYAEIIPNYVRVLAEGYRKAFDEIIERRRERAEKRKEDPAEVDLRVSRRELLLGFGPQKQAEIWSAAMQASWGQIDLAQFERDWPAFVRDVL